MVGSDNGNQRGRVMLTPPPPPKKKKEVVFTFTSLLIYQEYIRRSVNME